MFRFKLFSVLLYRGSTIYREEPFIIFINYTLLLMEHVMNLKFSRNCYIKFITMVKTVKKLYLEIKILMLYKWFIKTVAVHRNSVALNVPDY